MDTHYLTLALPPLHLLSLSSLCVFISLLLFFPPFSPLLSPCACLVAHPGNVFKPPFTGTTTAKRGPWERRGKNSTNTTNSTLKKKEKTKQKQKKR
jgi:hypothetical protein